MTFPEYESFDGLGLANLIQRKVMSPEELLIAAIERIEKHNPELNAVIYKMYDQARQALQAGLPAGPFQGVPFLLKDLLTEYAGAPLSSGSRFTQNWMPEHDSELALRIKKAGLVVLGKTNVPEFGLSSVTEPTLFGSTHNPWDLTRASGGSSGGSAAAVASGMVPMAHGNDGGGSIRIPASYCGIFGFKPSRGRTPSRSSTMRLWESLVVEHALTRTVRDSAAMLDVLSGPELGSSLALPLPETSFLSCLDQPLRSLRIAVTDQPFFSASVTAECEAAVQHTGKLCESYGHHVEVVQPHFAMTDVAKAYVMVTAGEISATIKRFSEQIGRKPKYHELEPQTLMLCHIGDRITAGDFAWAGGVLDEVSRHMAQFFQNYDVLITPTLNAAPPKIGEFAPTLFEQRAMEILARLPRTPLLLKALEQTANKNFALYPFTPIFNISGQPAMSLPLYLDKQGLPLGIQFAAKVGDEATLFQLAYQLEDHFICRVD